MKGRLADRQTDGSVVGRPDGAEVWIDAGSKALQGCIVDPIVTTITARRTNEILSL